MNWYRNKYNKLVKQENTNGTILHKKAIFHNQVLISRHPLIACFLQITRQGHSSRKIIKCCSVKTKQKGILHGRRLWGKLIGRERKRVSSTSVLILKIVQCLVSCSQGDFLDFDAKSWWQNQCSDIPLSWTWYFVCVIRKMSKLTSYSVVL